MPHAIRIKHRLTGSSGAPSSLSGSELAYNEVDSTLYYGASADSNGVAQVIVPIGGQLYVTLVSSLTASNASLYSFIQSLTAQNTTLYSTLTSVSASLQTQIDSLSAQNDVLFSTMVNISASLQSQIDSLSAQLP